jgi:hypothetical protein
MAFFEQHAPNRRKHNRPLPDLSQYGGPRAQREEAQLPSSKWEQEILRIKELGLEPADSIQDKTEISCFQRGSIPHWSGINTRMSFVAPSMTWFATAWAGQPRPRLRRSRSACKQRWRDARGIAGVR